MFISCMILSSDQLAVCKKKIFIYFFMPNLYTTDTCVLEEEQKILRI